MSWRVLILFLLLAVVASWQGGRQLGLWLIDQAPESIASTSSAKNDRSLVLDADGKPLAPQPPQPRIDGTLGVPKEMEPVEWSIAPIIASREDANSYEKEGEEDEESEGDERDGNTEGTDRIRTVDARPPVSVPTSPRPSVTSMPLFDWQDSLKQELAQCNSVGFFRRPGCIDAAQNKFCGPNNAWGKVAACPDRNTNSMTGG